MLRKKGRADGESAYPEIHVFFEAIRGVIRKRSENDFARHEARVAHFKAHPEMYETPDEAKEMAARIAGKFGIRAVAQDKAFKEIDRSPELVLCPKCQFEQPVASNIRHWTAKELYEMAAVKEQSELIAERNRSMSNLPLGDVVEEVTA